MSFQERINTERSFSSPLVLMAVSAKAGMAMVSPTPVPSNCRYPDIGDEQLLPNDTNLSSVKSGDFQEVLMFGKSRQA